MLLLTMGHNFVVPINWLWNQHGILIKKEILLLSSEILVYQYWLIYIVQCKNVETPLCMDRVYSNIYRILGGLCKVIFPVWIWKWLWSEFQTPPKCDNVIHHSHHPHSNTTKGKAHWATWPTHGSLGGAWGQSEKGGEELGGDGRVGWYVGLKVSKPTPSHHNQLSPTLHPLCYNGRGSVNPQSPTHPMHSLNPPKTKP